MLTINAIQASLDFYQPPATAAAAGRRRDDLLNKKIESLVLMRQVSQPASKKLCVHVSWQYVCVYDKHLHLHTM